MSASPGRRVLMALVAGAHGIRGDVVLKWLGEDPGAIGRYRRFEDEAGDRQFEVVSARSAKGDAVVAHLAGVESRDDAEALRGLQLFVARDAFAPTGEDEFYHADLVGLPAVDPAGRAIGRVVAMHNYGAGDIVEIEPQDGGTTVMLPFTRDFVPEVALGVRIVVDLPAEAAEDAGEEGREG